MRLRTSFIHPLAAICLALMPAAASAQQPVEAYKPQVGQHGKDVIWVPTPQALVDKMLDMAKVGPGDHVIDLGSGDGRTVITAAKRGATAHGIEYNPEMVELSKHNAVKAGVADKATFAKADIFESDFSKATVITLFLLPRLNLKLRPTILRMAPGTRIVSNSFDMDDWRPDQTAYVTDGCTGYCRAYLWIVPEKVARQLAAGSGRACPGAEVSGCHRHADRRQRGGSAQGRESQGRPHRLHRRCYALYRPGEGREHGGDERLGRPGDQVAGHAEVGLFQLLLPQGQ